MDEARERVRDQLADAGVAVQQQMRADQERIAELELQLEQAEKDCKKRYDWALHERDVAHARAEQAERERDALRSPSYENALSRWVVRAEAAEARLACDVPKLVEALREIRAVRDDMRYVHLTACVALDDWDGANSPAVLEAANRAAVWQVRDGAVQTVALFSTRERAQAYVDRQSREPVIVSGHAVGLTDTSSWDIVATAVNAKSEPVDPARS